MPLTYQWPLPADGIRFLVPPVLVAELAVHPLTQDLYPVATGYYPKAKGHVVSEEGHASHVLIYCTDGCGYLSLDGGEEHTIRRNDLIVLPAGQRHSYRSDNDDPWSIYWVQYRGALAIHYNQLLGVADSVVSIGGQPELIKEFGQLLALREEGFSQLAFIHAACQLKQMLSWLAMKRASFRQPSRSRIEVEQVQRLMLDSIDQHLDLDALAQEANLSKYHFTRRFKQLTGHSPIQYFIHLKMQHACELLDQGATSIKAVAASVGYSDPYYFSRLFKQVIGRSPSDYRKSREV